MSSILLVWTWIIQWPRGSPMANGDDENGGPDASTYFMG